MAHLYQCDRCGATYKEQSGEVSYTRGGLAWLPKMRSLCEDCMDDFELFMDNAKIVKPVVPELYKKNKKENKDGKRRSSPLLRKQS